MRRLTIPDDVIKNPAAVEILCAWMLPNEDIGFATTENPWPDPAALGIFFADIARHYFEVSGLPRGQWGNALRRVAEGIAAEIDA